MTHVWVLESRDELDRCDFTVEAIFRFKPLYSQLINWVFPEEDIGTVDMDELDKLRKLSSTEETVLVGDYRYVLRHYKLDK